MFKRLMGLICVIVMTTVLGGCDLLPTPGMPTGEPPAATMLPQLAGYNTVEGQTLTGYIGKLGGGASLLSGNPELAATLTAVDAIVGCYQQVGAVRARLYANQNNPLAAGTVAIADKKALLDPANLFRCVVPNVNAGASTQAIKFEPCKANYTLKKGDSEFYILYAATQTEVCQAFCSKLEGCTASK
jgi:hypothetical protein